VAAAAVRTLVGDSAGVCGRDSTAVRLWWLSHQVIRRPRTGLQVVVLLSSWPMVQTESSRALPRTRYRQFIFIPFVFCYSYWW